MTYFVSPSFHFSVEWGGQRMGFSEVLGLNMHTEVIPYRDSASPVYSETKMPGMVHSSNIILRRGIIQGDLDFINWFNTIKLNKVEKRDVTIKLLNENHEPIMIWRAKNAFPMRYSGPELRSTVSAIATEELEIAHEGLVVESDKVTK